MNLLQDLFLGIFNMGITAGYVILAVLLIRLGIRKAPKVFSYGLWSIVGFRLVCPFSFSSVLSIFNFINANIKSQSNGTMNYISSSVGSINTHNSAITATSNVINSSLPAAKVTASVDPMQIVLFLATLIWIVGISVLLIYSIISYLRLKYHLRKAVLMKDNIYECDAIPSPFVMGLRTPRIYIPFHLDKQELNYILLHETYHIKRFDYLIKPFSFLLLIIHWYNPLVWCAYMGMCKDMEMSCDEKVIQDIGISIKNDYSMSLLSFATNHKFSLAGPLTFGESNTKSRIKNILNYKKSKMWLIIITGTICLTALVVCTANPSDKIGQTAADEKTNNVKTTENSEYAKLLFSCKNRYIGNNSADGKLLNAIGVGENMGNFTIEMETSKTPYVLRLNFNNEVTDRDTFDRKMCPYAALLLALIDNADEIQWSYPYTQDGELQTITVYWNNQNLKSMGIDDIKSYGESVTQVQSLLKDLDSNALDIDLAYADNVTDISDGKPQDADTLIMNDILAQKDWGSLTIDYFKTFSNAVLEDNPDDSTLNSSIKFALLYGEETYELSVSYAKTDNRIDMIQLVKRSDMDSILLYSTEPKSSVNTDVKGFLE